MYVGINYKYNHTERMKLVFKGMSVFAARTFIRALFSNGLEDYLFLKTVK